MLKKKFFVYSLSIITLTLLFSIPLQSRAYASGNDDLLLKIQTDSNNEFYVPIDTNYTYNYNIDCDNDGSFEATGVSTDYTCSYGSSGTYTIRIEDNTGTNTGFPHIYFYNGGNGEPNLLEVQQWGTMKWQSMGVALFNCQNFTLTATDTPDLSNVTDMSYMFYNDTNFNADISSWDVSNITNMSHLFMNATSFNQPLNTWNTSNVTNISQIFRNASSFNQPLNDWDISNVTDLSYVFYGASSFNQPLNNWDTSNVTSMYTLFKGALNFNQDLSSWDVSNVTDMGGMLESTALSRTNYDNTLIGWNNLPSLQTNVYLGASGLHYCASESARANLISQYNWTIADEGKDCSVETQSGTLVITLSPETVNTTTTMTFEYTLPLDLASNANISIIYDSAFTGGDSLTNNDISVTSTNSNIGTCTASNFSNGYFDLTCTGTATSSEVLTITIGNSNKLTTPSTPGNYDGSIVIENDQYTYMNGASLAYIADDNDVNISAHVPSVLELDIYEINTNTETNSCDLGVLSVNKVNSCSYDISAGTNNPTGLTIMMHGVLTSDWSTGSNTLTHSDGSHTINAVSDGSVTAGYNEYGFQITDNGSNSYTANNSYDSQNSAVPSSESAIATTSTTLDGANDITKRLEITHYASMSNSTVAGNYSQGVIWTAFTN